MGEGHLEYNARIQAMREDEYPMLKGNYCVGTTENVAVV